MYQKAFIVTLLAVAVNQQLHAETAKHKYQRTMIYLPQRWMS